jgi:translocator protein
MLALLNKPSRAGLWANIGILLVAVIVVNGIIFGLHWDNGGHRAVRPWYVPPGAVVGIIWTVLFMLYGAARWHYVRDTGERGWRSYLVTGFAALCLAYPFYTGGLANMWIGLVSNALLLLVVIGLSVWLRPKSRRAAQCLIPTIVWMSYALFITYEMLGQ